MGGTPASSNFEYGARLTEIILLGNGRVGKTQLCRRFREEPYDETTESTHGVQLWRQELRLKVGGEEETFQVNWWDFGGQDIYHGTHALFLKSRAVFLILWTPELENRDEYFEGEIPLRNQPLAYWLEYVRSLAGGDSPVIVVQSQCDLPQDRAKDPARPKGLGFFECCAYSAKENRGREALEAHLREAMRYLLRRSGRYEIGHGRAEVRRRLQARFAVTLPRFDLLAQLDKVPDGLTLGETSRRMMVSNANVTTLVERLVADGLISRRTDPRDRRTSYISLTPKGRTAFAAMARAHEGWIAELFQGLDGDEIATLMRLLGKAKASAGRSTANGARR